MHLSNIPERLQERPQWVVWRYIPRRNGKPQKPPYNPVTGAQASHSDPTTWGTFEEALAAYQQGGYAGLGYVFSEDDPFTGIDLDDDYVQHDGQPTADAWEIITHLSSYTERSPSGKGLHIICDATLTEGGHKRGDIEMYDRQRYFTVTGDHLTGTPTTINPRQQEVDELHAACFSRPDRVTPPPKVVTFTAGLHDSELLEMASQAVNGATFDALFRGNWSGYKSQSEADLAFCGMLAFWTGGDVGRMDRLFRQSGLFREKWDRASKGSTYGKRTIDRALAGCSEFYAPTETRQEALEAALEHAQRIDWGALAKELTERARGLREAGHKWAKGTNRATLRAAHLCLLELARREGGIVISVSYRQLGEAMGKGWKAAGNALKGLVTLGLWEPIKEHDYLDAGLYRLAAQDTALQDTPPINTGGGEEGEHNTCVDGGCVLECGILLDQDFINEYSNDDLFLHGARINPEYTEDPRVTFGPVALEVLAALSAQGNLSFADIAEATGGNARTIGQKVHELATWGIVTLAREGRRYVVNLAADWRARVEGIRRTLTTYGRSALRKVEHLTDRVRNLYNIFTKRRNHPPDKVRERMGEVWEQYRDAEEELLRLESELPAIDRVLERARNWRRAWLQVQESVTSVATRAAA